MGKRRRQKKNLNISTPLLNGSKTEESINFNVVLLR
jgi:hypothetical protein